MKIKKDKDMVNMSNITMADSIRVDNTTYSWLKYILDWARKRNNKAITVSVREDDKIFLNYCKLIGFTVLRTFIRNDYTIINNLIYINLFTIYNK